MVSGGLRQTQVRCKRMEDSESLNPLVTFVSFVVKNGFLKTVETFFILWAATFL